MSHGDARDDGKMIVLKRGSKFIWARLMLPPCHPLLTTPYAPASVAVTTTSFLPVSCRLHYGQRDDRRTPKDVPGGCAHYSVFGM